MAEVLEIPPRLILLEKYPAYIVEKYRFEFAIFEDFSNTD